MINKALEMGQDWVYLVHHLHAPVKVTDMEEVHHCWLFSEKNLKGDKYEQVHVQEDKDTYHHAIKTKNVDDIPKTLWDHLNNKWKIVTTTIDDKSYAIIKPYKLSDLRWSNQDKKESDMSDTIYKYFTVDKGEFDEKDFTVTATASKEVIDRDGDLIKVDGIDLKNWKKNPVIMLFHNYADFPIGVGVGKKAWVDGKELKIKFKFLIDDNDKAFQAARLWKAGALKGLSIGFKPDYNAIEYPERKEGKVQPGRIFKSIELLEVSVVPIPSNQDALMASVSKSLDAGEIDMDDFEILKDMLKEAPTSEAPDTETYEQKIAALEQKITELEAELELTEEDKEVDIYDAIFKQYGIESKEHKLNRLLEEL